MPNFLLDDILHGYLVQMFENMAFFDRSIFNDITWRVAKETSQFLWDDDFKKLQAGSDILIWKSDLTEYMVCLKIIAYLN